MSLSGFFAVENPLAVENFSTPVSADCSQTGGRDSPNRPKSNRRARALARLADILTEGGDPRGKGKD